MARAILEAAIRDQDDLCDLFPPDSKRLFQQYPPEAVIGTAPE
jgi:hypothetical protein